MAVVKSTDVELEEGRPGLKSRSLINEGAGAASFTMGELIFEPGVTLPLHKHLVEEAFYILKGSGKATVGEETFTVEEGTALLAPAGVVHGFTNDGDALWRVLYMYPAIQPKAEFV